VASDTPPPATGPAHRGGLAGLPKWVLYGGAGLAVGVVYLIWKGHKTASAAGQTGTATNTTGTGSPPYGAPQGPDIIPIDQGLTDQQVGDIVAAISGLQGQQSAPPPTTTPAAAWTDAEATALAAFTGESVDQVKWELEGKDPSQGPAPDPNGKHLPNSNLYGSWAGIDPATGVPSTSSGGDNSRGGDGQPDQDHGSNGRGGQEWQGQGNGGGGGRRGGGGRGRGGGGQ
jgi:hypothetical protein